MTAQDDRMKDNAPSKKEMDSTTMRLYHIVLVLSGVVLALSAYTGSFLDITISAAVICMVLFTIAYDRRIIHIPPLMIILMFLCMAFSALSRTFFDYGIMALMQNLTLGALLSLMGFICAYVALGKMPGFSDERPAFVSLQAFTFGVALYATFVMFMKYFGDYLTDSIDYNELFDSMAYVTLGSLAISIFFYIDKTSVFKYTVFNFMWKNQAALGLKSENERLEIERLIQEGESDTLEFKSTLRTNLKTGEKDKRMEKAVLKTITAFMNTDGGTLLIGVEDDGNILGIDEESFDSRDRMNLHMTNLISSQIGDEFLPYIRFKLINFGENGEKAVMRVTCKSCKIPVFLKDNKTEQYYVRSGPSSTELTGSDMIRYIGRTQRIRRLKMPAGPQQTSEDGPEE